SPEPSKSFDQIVSHAARYRNRTRGRFTVPMVLRMPYGAGINAPEHHSESIEALYTHIPGLKVVVPSTPADAKGLLISAIRDSDPVVYIEPKKIYRSVKGEIPEGDHTVPIGKARTVREGTDLTIVSWGAMVPVSEQAAKQLESENVSAELIDLRTLAPFDLDAVLTSVKKTGRLVVVHEAARTGGLGADLSSLVSERLFEYLLAPVKRVTGFDVTPPYAKLEKYTLPTAKRVLRGIKETLNF
ncbi:alpha-ketoacid dehydrogenase subunit beta, partial [candidate division KSB1 bacterium]